MSQHHRSLRERRRDHPDREERRAARRERLLESAITVVRREGPAVSMEAIAAEAGITKPIVYRAFGDREGLTKAIADRFADELTKQITDAIERDVPDRERVSGTIDAYLAFVEREPEIVRFLIHRSASDIEEQGIAMAPFVRRISEQVAQALGEGLRARGLDSGAAEVWAYGIVGMVHLAGDQWIDRKTMPRERLVEYLTTLVWDGLDSLDRDQAGSDGSVAISMEGRR